MNKRHAVTGHRIVTLCMNPALDITTSTEVVRPTDKLRCAPPRYDPGGGGINVAHVAQVAGRVGDGGVPGRWTGRRVGHTGCWPPKALRCNAFRDRRIDPGKPHRQ